MKKQSALHLLLLVLFQTILTQAGCQSSPESEARLQRVISNLLADRGLRMTQSKSLADSKRFYYDSDDGSVTAGTKESQCFVTFSTLSSRLRNAPRRTGQRPFASVDSVLNRYLAPMKVVLGTSSLDTNFASVHPDALQRDGTYSYGRTGVRFRIKVNGFAFIDRLYGSDVGVDQVSGKILYYSDRLSRPNVAIPEVNLTEVEAREKAAQSLNVAHADLQYQGRGYAAAENNATAVVCYGYRYVHTGRQNEPSSVAIVFIRADNGAVLKTER